MNAMTKNAAWIDELQCYVEEFDICFIAHTAEVWMPDGSCTDMSGAINYFTALDPDVKSIITWSGGRADTSYVRGPDGWTAIPHR